MKIEIRKFEGCKDEAKDECPCNKWPKTQICVHGKQLRCSNDTTEVPRVSQSFFAQMEGDSTEPLKFGAPKTKFALEPLLPLLLHFQNSWILFAFWLLGI
jgi:hypothetical protein